VAARDKSELDSATELLAEFESTSSISAMSEQPDNTSAAARLAPIIAFKLFFIHSPFLNVAKEAEKRKIRYLALYQSFHKNSIKCF